MWKCWEYDFAHFFEETTKMKNFLRLSVLYHKFVNSDFVHFLTLEETKNDSWYFVIFNSVQSHFAHCIIDQFFMALKFLSMHLALAWTNQFPSWNFFEVFSYFHHIEV